VKKQGASINNNDENGNVDIGTQNSKKEKIVSKIVHSGTNTRFVNGGQNSRVVFGNTNNNFLNGMII
jgi:hypothetical protein